MRVQGETSTGVPFDLCAEKGQGGELPPLQVSFARPSSSQPWLSVAGSFSAFYLAANSYFTLKVMASVFTLYMLAASQRIVAGVNREAASRIHVSTADGGAYLRPRGGCE
jgi:hypothetical protein